MRVLFVRDTEECTNLQVAVAPTQALTCNLHAQETPFTSDIIEFLYCKRQIFFSDWFP